MLRVGLTGGIGSGKSTAARIFEALGVPVYVSDDRAKALMNGDEELISQIKAEFGDEAYLNGALDRSRMAALAFSDKGALARLNAIAHPAVLADFDLWARVQNAPYVVMESAIIFEAGIAPLLDYVITVSAPVEERLDRAVRRDGSDPEGIRRRMGSQMSDSEREARADFTLDNSDEALLLPRIIEIHEKLVAESTKDENPA